MKRAIASASLLALGAASAAAQLVNADKPWSISGTLNGFYDDNINTAPEGPGRVDSFGIEVIPAGSVHLQSGPTTFVGSIVYDNSYYFERRNTDQSLDLGLNLNQNFSSRFSADVNEHFILGQEPQILSGSGPVVTPLRSNGNNIHNIAGISFQAQVTRLFGLIFSYDNNIYDYQENAGNTVTPGSPSRSALLDYIQHTFTLDSTWTISDTTRGIFGYKFDAVLYNSPESIMDDPNGPPFVDGYPYGGPFYFPSDARNNYSHFFYVGADEAFNPHLSGSARLGFQYVDYYQTGVQDPANPAIFDRTSKNSIYPYVNLTANYTYANSGVLSFGFNYSLNQTDVAASSSDPTAGTTLDQTSATVYLTATQQLTPLTPKLTASGTLQYQNSVFNGGPSDGEVDNFFTLNLGLAYAFTQHLSAVSSYNYTLLASDLNGRGYDRNQVYLGMKAAY
jgi:Putative beta-barrel porin 2